MVVVVVVVEEEEEEEEVIHLKEEKEKEEEEEEEEEEVDHLKTGNEEHVPSNSGKAHSPTLGGVKSSSAYLEVAAEQFFRLLGIVTAPRRFETSTTEDVDDSGVNAFDDACGVLDAATHLYKRVCPSVRRSAHAMFVKIVEMCGLK